MKILNNVPLKNYTTWKIGGPAKIFFQPENIDQLKNFLQNLPKTEKIIWMGGGSNVLVRDQGIDAAVICVNRHLQNCENCGEYIRAYAGSSIAKLLRFSWENNLSGLEFLAGIPGTVGGALAMNAGAFGDEIWRYVVAIETITRDGIITKRPKADFTFAYRSINGLVPEEWILAGYFDLKIGDIKLAKEAMLKYINKRKLSQPFDKPSCGSVFKNPVGDYAGRLIEACGLKGFSIGGAMISPKHANFIVNIGEATATDVESLMKLIVEKVQNKFNVVLEPEVKIFG